MVAILTPNPSCCHISFPLVKKCHKIGKESSNDYYCILFSDFWEI